VLWFWDHATDSRGADVAGESLAVGGQREPPVWSGAQQGPWGGRVATRLFSDDQLERLRSFPDIGRDELIRFFALTSPCSVRCQLALVGSKPYRRSRTLPPPWRPGRRRRQVLPPQPRWRRMHVGRIGRLPAKSVRWLGSR